MVKKMMEEDEAIAGVLNEEDEAIAGVLNEYLGKELFSDMEGVIGHGILARKISR